MTTTTATTTTATFHRSAAVTALDLAIAELSKARAMLETQDEALANMQEEETLEEVDAALCSAVDKLENLQDAMSAAGQAYFGDDGGNYYIGVIAAEKRRLAR